MLKRKKRSQKLPHFLSLNQDIVARSQEEKCGLKYVIHSPGMLVLTPEITLKSGTGIM